MKKYILTWGRTGHFKVVIGSSWNKLGNPWSRNNKSKNILCNQHGNARKKKGRVWLNGTQEGDLFSKSTHLVFVWSAQYCWKHGYCFKNVRSFVETGQRNEQKLLNSPTTAMICKPVASIVFDEMTVPRRTVSISGTVFLVNGKISAMSLDNFLMGTELSD